MEFPLTPLGNFAKKIKDSISISEDTYNILVEEALQDEESNVKDFCKDYIGYYVSTDGDELTFEKMVDEFWDELKEIGKQMK